MSELLTRFTFKLSTMYTMYRTPVFFASLGLLLTVAHLFIGDFSFNPTVDLGILALNIAISLITYQLQSAFSLDDTVFETIRKHVPAGGVVVELGSGPGTSKLTKHFTVYSVEHDSAWVGYVPTSNYIHAPIVQEKVPEFSDSTGWYDPAVLKKKLPKNYDFLLVDGPPSFYGRGGFYAHLDLFDTSVPILIDDANRGSEMKLLELLSKKLGRKFDMITYGGKQCGLIHGEPRKAK